MGMTDTCYLGRYTYWDEWTIWCWWGTYWSSRLIIIVDQLIGKSPNLKQFVLQDSEWEEVDAEDAETDQDILYPAGGTLSGRVKNSYLESMAKAFNEVCWNAVYFLYTWTMFIFYIFGKLKLKFIVGPVNFKDQDDGFEDELLSSADPLNKVTSLHPEHSFNNYHCGQYLCVDLIFIKHGR